MKNYLDQNPRLGARVFIHNSAVVIGDVVLGDDCSIWPTAVIRGDMQMIRIGDRCSIQDGSVLHITHDGPYSPGGNPLIIGNDVTIGHKVILHGCTVDDLCLIGMGSIVMDKAIIQSQVILGAQSLVPPGKVLESGFLYVGSPAKKVRPLTKQELEFLPYTAANYVKLKDQYLNLEV